MRLLPYIAVHNTIVACFLPELGREYAHGLFFPFFQRKMLFVD